MINSNNKWNYLSRDSLGELSTSFAGSSASSTSTRLRMLKTLFATLVFCMSPTPSVALLVVVLRSIVDCRTIFDSGEDSGHLTSSHHRHRNRAVFVVDVVVRIFVHATSLTTHKMSIIIRLLSQENRADLFALPST